MSTHPVYLERGARRTFAGALEWPGWCRSGRSDEEALAALAEYGRRYAKAVPRALAFQPPSGEGHLDVVEELKGDATTDFGAPHIAPRADERPLDPDELARQSALLKACWKAFDGAMKRTAAVELRKGPRGGGRDHARMASHVLEAEASYLTQLGARRVKTDGLETEAAQKQVRAAVLDTLSVRASGGTIEGGSRVKKLWLPRYFVRRAAWHVLDHAWEIEDRATPV